MGGGGWGWGHRREEHVETNWSVSRDNRLIHKHEALVCILLWLANTPAQGVPDPIKRHQFPPLITDTINGERQDCSRYFRLTSVVDYLDRN